MWRFFSCSVIFQTQSYSYFEVSTIFIVMVSTVVLWFFNKSSNINVIIIHRLFTSTCWDKFYQHLDLYVYLFRNWITVNISYFFTFVNFWLAYYFDLQWKVICYFSLHLLHSLRIIPEYILLRYSNKYTLWLDVSKINFLCLRTLRKMPAWKCMMEISWAFSKPECEKCTVSKIKKIFTRHISTSYNKYLCYFEYQRVS